MYRSHLGTLPDENWQFNSDMETFLHFFNMTVVFQSWDFYRKTLMEEAYKMGWPVARHMFLVFSNNSVAYTNPHVRFQFMLGTELLVAPVFKEGSSSVKVFLPANTTWIHVWTNKIYKGMTKLSIHHYSLTSKSSSPGLLHLPFFEVKKVLHIVSIQSSNCKYWRKGVGNKTIPPAYHHSNK